MKEQNSSPVKVLNFLRKESKKFVGNGKPYPNETQLVNDAIRKHLERLQKGGKKN